MVSFISLLEIISAILPDPNIFYEEPHLLFQQLLLILTVLKRFKLNGLSTFSIKGNPVFNNGPKSLPKNTSDCSVLCNCVFDNFMSADEPFPKALQSFETYVLVNNNLCRKLFPLLEPPIIFDQIFKATSVPFFIPVFNLLICELDNFTFKVLYKVTLY